MEEEMLLRAAPPKPDGTPETDPIIAMNRLSSTTAVDEDFRWVPLDALPDDMVPYVRRAIELWRAGTCYSESGWER